MGDSNDEALEFLTRSLAEMGVSPEAAQQAVRHGARSVEEAIALLNGEGPSHQRGASQTSGDPSAWEEHWSAEHGGRPYYHHRQQGTTQWEEPVALRALRLQVAQGIYDLPLARCERIAAALEALLALPPGPRGDVSALEAEPLNPTLATLRKILSNIVSSPANPKFRTVKKANGTFRKVWDVELGKRVLLECGFVQTEEAVTLAQEAALGPVRFIVSRLQEAGECIRNTAPIDIRGDGAEGAQWEQAGNAHMQGAGPSSATPSAARWQKEIHYCKRCKKFINDGSERVWTRQHDAPPGEFRYACTTCPDFSLCEICWDAYNEGRFQHDQGHTFEHIHPISSRHNTTIHGQGPWGNFGGSVSSRSRDRLKERTGL
ncbi:hypothetical protein CYMTET_21418 [Cymbomonas tetramitiformis]|uniref:WW domain-containing protein n=1 Tax=Cymbomonas tetramitiformis TaxID=36881 RepID=A0AAE0G3D9_9CHLO|nr:hypothetical protein CYMTET_21418 [Cymbomonas tetramitiformis]